MCATSIGSTLSHRPVPGERTSGTRLGTELPAPGRATVRFEERSSSARRSVLIEVRSRQFAVGSLYCELRSANCSLSFELRLPLLHERPNTLARVLRAERGREALLLGGDAFVEVTLVRD